MVEALGGGGGGGGGEGVITACGATPEHSRPCTPPLRGALRSVPHNCSPEKR